MRVHRYPSDTTDAEWRLIAPLPVVIDSQTVRAAETVARSSRGYDAAKRINGRKRSVAVDLGGLLWPRW